MRKHVNKIKIMAVATTVTAMLAVVVAELDAGGDPPTVRALVLTDLGDPGDIVTRMQAHGWEVTTSGVLPLLSPDTDGFSAFNLVWIPAQANFPGIHRLVTSGALDVFIKQGGVLVVADADPEGVWPDLAPGGADVEALPAGGAGPLTITTPDHPMITGAGTGGVPVTAEDLDPQGTGGRAGVINAPQQDGLVVVASNSLGAALLEHTHGSGRVLISALLNATENCVENTLLYIQSIVQ